MFENILANSPASLGAAIVFFIGYVFFRIIYDLFLHPLRKFPGPKMAAVGSFYEFYYDVIKDGTYIWEIEKMHKKYGPIVRINSRAIHIHDPQYFSTVYAGGSHRINKDTSAVRGYTFPGATIATIDHDLHRKRRAILSPYFSKRAVSGLEPIINERLEVLCSRVRETVAQGTAIDLTSAFSAFTADVVTHHFYGSHQDFLSTKDFHFALKVALTALFDFYHLTRFLPVPGTTLKNIPLPILRKVNRNLSVVMDVRNTNKENIVKSLQSEKETQTKSKSVIVSALADRTVPAAEKTMDRMLDEGETIIFAGIDTTARSLSVAFYHLLNDQRHIQKMRTELDSLQKPTNEAWTTAELESLPYLRGVVQEALRLSHGLVVRIPRVATKEALQYGDFTIPPGTPVSQSTYLIHNDPSIFPDPKSFEPERWSRAAQQGVNLEKYLVSFSKGSRVCLGMSLAYAMLYHSVAKIVSQFDMDLYDTKLENIEVYHTRGVAFPREGSVSVKAKVVKVLS